MIENLKDFKKLFVSFEKLFKFKTDCIPNFKKCSHFENFVQKFKKYLGVAKQITLFGICSQN